MSDTDQRLKEEAEKWLNRAIERRKVLSLRDPEDKRYRNMLQNVDNYISDCRHFLKNNMLIEAFEASVWAWAWIEIMERLGITIIYSKRYGNE